MMTRHARRGHERSGGGPAVPDNLTLIVDCTQLGPDLDASCSVYDPVISDVDWGSHGRYVGRVLVGGR